MSYLECPLVVSVRVLPQALEEKFGGGGVGEVSCTPWGRGLKVEPGQNYS